MAEERRGMADAGAAKTIDHPSRRARTAAYVAPEIASFRPCLTHLPACRNVHRGRACLSMCSAVLLFAVGSCLLFFLGTCSSHSQLTLFFFFNDTAPTEIYTLSLHDALPIFTAGGQVNQYRIAWSADGTKILFDKQLFVETFYGPIYPTQIYVINADGTNQRNLSNNNYYD